MNGTNVHANEHKSQKLVVVGTSLDQNSKSTKIKAAFERNICKNLSALTITALPLRQKFTETNKTE